MPLANPYGSLGYEPGITLQGGPGSYQGLRSTTQGGENTQESFGVPDDQVGKYSQQFDLNGTNYTRTGMPVDDFFQNYQNTKSISPFGKDTIGYIEDPTYGYAAPTANVGNILNESSQIQTKNNTSGFWNGPGPMLLAAAGFLGPALFSGGALGAEGGAFGGAQGSAAIGGAGADTLGGGIDLAQLSNPAYLQSFSGMSSPGLLGTPGLGTSIADPTFAGIAGGGGAGLAGGEGSNTYFNDGSAPYAGDAAYEESGLTDLASRTGETALNGSPNFIQNLISSLSDPKQLLSRLASSAGQQALSGFEKNPLGTALSIGSGIYGLSESRKLRQLAQQQAAAADPFGPYRPQFAQQLAELSADPSKITQTPGYNAGLQAVERRMASQGFNGSGNMMAALAKYGGDFFQQESSRLAGLGGANLNPAAASQILLNGTSGSIDLAGRSLASIGYGVGNNNQNGELAQALRLAMLGMGGR